MDAFNYAMALVSIVVGLAISTLAANLHRLIRHRRTVVWDARTILAAVFTFLMLFTMWFEVWSVRKWNDLLSFPILLSILVEFVLLSLMAIAVLPDECSADTRLPDHYDAQSSKIWGLFLLFQLSYFSHWVYFMLTSPKYSLDRIIDGLPETLLMPVAAVILMLSPRRRGLHLIVVSLLLAYVGFMYHDARIDV